jgi:hypothetical protein
MNGFEHSGEGNILLPAVMARRRCPAGQHVTLPRLRLRNGNAVSTGCDPAFMNSRSDNPDPEWRSYVDDEDQDEEYLAPNPFALPLPRPTEQENK